MRRPHKALTRFGYELELHKKFMRWWIEIDYRVAQCTRCEKLKPDIWFYHRGVKVPGGPAYLCPDCAKILQFAMKALRQQKMRHKKITDAPCSLTGFEWWGIIEKQGGRCATCQRTLQ